MKIFATLTGGYGVPVIITNTMNNFGFMQSGSKFPVIIQKRSKMVKK